MLATALLVILATLLSFVTAAAFKVRPPPSPHPSNITNPPPGSPSPLPPPTPSPTTP